MRLISFLRSFWAKNWFDFWEFSRESSLGIDSKVVVPRGLIAGSCTFFDFIVITVFYFLGGLFSLV